MAELSTRAGVPVATVKFYLREGLLPPGARTSATQASYDETHIRRLRVIRALIDAGVGISGARKVLAALDEPPTDPFELLGAAHAAVAPQFEVKIRLTEAEQLAERLGFQPGACEVERLADVARALQILRGAGFEIPADVMTAYLQGMKSIATAEIAGIPVDDPHEAVRYVVLGTALAEPLLLALRRMAEQVAAAERFSPSDELSSPS